MTLNRSRCQQVLDGLRAHLSVFEVLATLANLALADWQCRERSSPPRWRRHDRTRGRAPGRTADLECITKAWNQAERDIRFLHSAPEVQFLNDRKGTIRVRGADIARIHVLIPTLHPLTSWSIQARDLVRAGVLPPGARPWITSVTDLRIVCESLRGPAELFAYLEWRDRALEQDGLLVPDEVELFGASLCGIDLSALAGGATVAVIMDMQADFDAYHEAMTRGETAEPPRKRVTSTVRDFLTEQERKRPPGWLSESVACLTAPYVQLVAVQACCTGDGPPTLGIRS